MRVLEVHTSNISKSFFEDHYRVYDGGVEEIRNIRESDGQKWSFSCIHSEFQSPQPWWMEWYLCETSECTCTGLQWQWFWWISLRLIWTNRKWRVSVRNFHWKKRTRWATQETQTISVLELSSKNYWNACGKPELSRESVCLWGRKYVSKLHQSTVITLDKVLGGLESLIEQFTGERFKGRSYQRSKETSRIQVKSGNAKATEKLWHNCREIR